jgi:hypothetical protein
VHYPHRKRWADDLSLTGNLPLSPTTMSKHFNLRRTGTIRTTRRCDHPAAEQAGEPSGLASARPSFICVVPCDQIRNFSAGPIRASSSNYSITSSALARSVDGILRSRVAAVFRFTASSNRVGRSKGSSAGFAPFRILSSSDACRSPISPRSGP